MKNKLITITLLIIGALLIITPASAIDETFSLGLFMPSTAGGTGTYFGITDSDYLNISIQSSEEITVSLESIPKVVSLTIEASNLSDSSILTVGGLEPNKTYHKYEDSFKNEAVFNSDENGSYGWAQDLTQSHRVWIQEEKGTTLIPVQCSGYGIWDENSFTCTLTQDIVGSLEITQSNIVLDCNGHSIVGSGGSYSIGIYLRQRTGVTIKNCNVDNFSYGILLSDSKFNELRGNNVSNSSEGIRLDWNSSNNFLIRNSSFNNSSYGVMLSYGSNNNILRNNSMHDNKYNFGVWGFETSDYIQSIDTSNTVDGKPIYYLIGEQNRVIDASSNAGYVGIVNSQDIEVRGLVLESNFQALVAFNTHELIIDNLTLSNNLHGIYLHSVSNTTTTQNNITGGLNGFGIAVHFSDHNSVTDNILTQNGGGIELLSASYNNITGNTISFNNPGIYISNASHNIISGNQILSNNYYGVQLVSSYNNLVSDNTIVDNKFGGIRLSGSYDNVIIENTIAENKSYASFGYGIDFTHALSANNKIYHNNFIDNYYKPQVRVLVGVELNIFDDGYQSGGNYWSDYDSVAEGCLDGNGDGFCDAPYTFTGGQDNYPFMEENGWEVKTLHEKAADLVKQLVNHPEAYLWGGKGWDYNLAQFVPAANILSSYTYWNPTLFGLDTGIGVDCSGLITWAFNRTFDAFMPAVNNFVKYVNANGLYSDFQSDAVTETELLPGDAMFFDWGKFNEQTQIWDGIKDGYIDHTAMYVGESGGYNIVNAASPRLGIIATQKDLLDGLTGFEDFRHIHQADVEMEITVGSPVDLVVTDPDGFTVTFDSVILSDEEYIREIPNTLYYLEMEQGPDGNPIDRVYSPILKIGNYNINVIPSTDRLPTDTYSLEFTTENQTINLAENVPINQIPDEGYGVSVAENGTINPFIPVSIDIKPGSYPNSINLGSNGVVPIAIFGSATLDVHQIDPITIKLANALSKLKGNGQPIVSYSDINEDGFTDIVVHIITDALQLTSTDVDAELDGFLLDGQEIKGSDSIRVVP